MRTPFLSCDWGTSSFRLRFIENGRVARDYRTADGCRAMFERAKQTGDTSTHARGRIYSEFLRAVLTQWDDLGRTDDSIPLIVSGMASSSIGWQEVPYASVPLKLDGSNLRFETLDWEKPRWLSETYLLSGLATNDDILRGEETEAIGLLASSDAPQNCILVLPGTHSKHLRIDARQITDFCTYMTGEIFEALSRNTLLKATIESDSLQDDSSANLDAFDAGVLRVFEHGLLRSLFQIRTRAVLHSIPKSENTWFLSGVLIGAELADLARSSGAVILIAGSQSLQPLYRRAMRLIEPQRMLPDFTPEQLERAVPAGHEIFLAQRIKSAPP